MRKNYKFILGVIVGAIIFTTIGVYAATQIISSQVTYKDNKSVQDAIDELYDKANNVTTNCSGNSIKCKRATTLHTETCSQTDATYYCSGAGYTTGSTITYGNLGTKGTLKSGDAFDCDVNGDGTYDAEIERFYYVSNYYNTTTKQFDTSKAVLIYYNNVSEGVANNITTYAYHSSNYNYQGPVTAKSQLPTIEQWNNVSLKNTERAILNETGGTTTTGGTLPTNFSYEGYAARLLTAKEVNAACNIIVGSYTTGELDTCQYLMENTKFANSSLTFGYWLETAVSSDSKFTFSVHSLHRCNGYASSYLPDYFGVRPVIEVSVTDIEY